MSTAAAAAAQPRDITKWASKDGEFRRLPSTFRSHIEVGGEFPPEKGRYMLYVSYACPWAHRALIVRQLKHLEEFIDVSVVHPHMGKWGWGFFPPPRGAEGEYLDTEAPTEVGADDGIAGVVPDPLYNAKFLRELYFKAEEGYTGRFTVPLLWDQKEGKIVNNESSEIIRMFNTEFNPEIAPEFAAIDLYPAPLQAEIEAQNEWVYPTVNNGVYRSGFATKQKAYEEAVIPLFESLDRLEKLLEGGKTFIIGDQLTECDVRLFTTIVRFDPVYFTHFKTNIRTIRSGYPNLNHWMKNLYHSFPAFGPDTTNFEHIKHHYFSSHPNISPSRIVPVGPLPHIEPL